MDKQDTLVFSVVMARGDIGLVELATVTSKKEAEEIHKTLVSMWAKCVADSIPFVIEKPMLDAFPPSVILRIYVEELTVDEWNNRQNPYHKQASQNGFTATMDKYFSNGKA